MNNPTVSEAPEVSSAPSERVIAAFVARDLRLTAAKWRAKQDRHDLEKTGYVVIYCGGAIGWTSDARDAKSWVPGCYAVPVTGPIRIATGGNNQAGAATWEEVRS